MGIECREVRRQLQGPKGKQKPRGIYLGWPQSELWGQHREGHSWGLLPDSPHHSAMDPGGLWTAEGVDAGWRQDPFKGTELSGSRSQVFW